MPAPPEEFLALQVGRLNEALVVAYGAMSGGNLQAVDRVVKIVRELDRYHGLVVAERRLSPSQPRLEAPAESPLALAARRALAQKRRRKPLKCLNTGPGLARLRQPSPRDADPSEAPPSRAPADEVGGPANRPRMAPEAPDIPESAPESSAATEGSNHGDGLES